MVRWIATARRAMAAALPSPPVATPTGGAANAWTRLTRTATRIFLLAALAVPGPAWAAANQWMKLSPPTSTRRFPNSWVNCAPTLTSGNPVGRSYSSMINGPSGKLLYWGGGHGSHPGNDAEVFDTATQTWMEQFTPECIDTCCRVCSNDPGTTCTTSTDCVSPGTCGTASPLCGTTGRCAVTGCSCVIMTGVGSTQVTTGNRPYVDHAYQAYTYNANPSRQHYLFSLTSGVWSYVPPDTWTLLTSTQPALPNSPWGSGKLLAYDPTVRCGSDTGAVLMFANPPSGNGVRGIYCFDYSQSAWAAFDLSATAFPSAMRGSELTGTWDSTRQEHIISDSNEGIWRYNASTKSWTNTNAPAAAIQTISQFFSTAVAYDSVHDITLALVPQSSGAPDMWQYNNATSVWTDVDDARLGTLPPSGVDARWNPWRYDSGMFYLLANASVGSGGQGGTPDDSSWGSTTWTFQWSNPPLAAAPTVSVAAATTTPTVTPTLTSTPTVTPTGPTPTITMSPSAPLTWAQRAAQPGVLAAIGFHNSTEVAAYATVSSLTGQGPSYDPVVDAARFPVINTMPAAQFNQLDNYAWSGFLAYSLPWAQQFDENSEFEVQYLFRDDDWATELTNKKVDIWGAGDRNPSSPPVTGGPTKSGSCMPDDVVTEYLDRVGSKLHVGLLSGYQGCSSGPAWGNSYAGQVGIDFRDFSPPRDDYWYQPAVPSCLATRVYNKTVDPGQVCTVIGANVWQAVTMHFKLGPRGLCTGYCYGVGPWADISRWQPNHAYAQGSKVLDSNGNFQWAAYTSGTSGSTEPTWLTAGGSGTTADGATLKWYFYGGPKDWFTNSYFWLAFGWEGHPSTALIYRGPFNYYSPISFTLDYGSPPPMIGKLWLFPYRQASYDQIGASAMTSTSVTVTGSAITEAFPAGSSVTDPYTGYTTLTADVHPGDSTIYVADTSGFRSPVTAVRLWRQMKAGSRWYKEMLIATGSTLADPFGTAPITWPTPPNAAADWPGSTAPPSGQVPTSVAATRPTPPLMLP
jgi:hypothetical protein